VNGTIRVLDSVTTSTLSSGQLYLSRSTAPISYTAVGPVFLLRSVVSVIHFPAYLLDAQVLPFSTSDRSRVVPPFVAFIRQLAIAPPEGSGSPAEFLARALAEMQIALIAGQASLTDGSNGLERRRLQIRDHINRHLDQVDLGPQSIADALGVSVAYVHRAFNSEDVSVARYVRERRLEAVTVALRNDAAAQPSDLARRFGFASEQHLARAFKSQCGANLAHSGDQVYAVSPN
jgi:AraC-like DNA-binding protein